MRWFFYNLLFAVVYVAMVPGFVLRMRRRGGYRNRFAGPVSGAFRRSRGAAAGKGRRGF
jgi:hypothetical protein